jgi:hypothetical protein
MRPMRHVFLLSIFALVGCGEAVQDNHFADDVREDRQATPAVTSAAVPVRVGDLGPNFPACNAAGVTRHLAAGETLPARSAPFETAAETGRIPAGGRFFICSRSLDQKWFGVVYDNGGDVARCGVLEPVASRRGYDGPCGSGWVAAPYVKFVARADLPQQTDSRAK